MFFFLLLFTACGGTADCDVDCAAECDVALDECIDNLDSASDPTACSDEWESCAEACGCL